MKYDGDERRRYKRVDTLLHVMIRVHSHNWDEITGRFNGTVVNLSRDSMLIKADGDMAEGDRVTFLIHSKRRKTRYQVKGIISQKRSNNIVVMITDCSPPDFVITDFEADEMDRAAELSQDEMEI